VWASSTRGAARNPMVKLIGYTRSVPASVLGMVAGGRWHPVARKTSTGAATFGLVAASYFKPLRRRRSVVPSSVHARPLFPTPGVLVIG
jgi:hypothetical protein